MPEEQGPIFEWDQLKSERNVVERGFDFEYACRVFDGDTLEREDTRHAYAEVRIVAIGEIGDEIYVVVYASGGDIRRMISARRASRRERDAYREAFTGRNL